MVAELDPSVEHAVWDGRFQPFHRGHLAVIRRILDVHPGPLVVMIIQSSTRDHDSAYSAQVDLHHQSHRNPLSLWERFCIVRMALDAAALAQRVTVLGILRPDLYWPVTQQFYPPNRFICLTGKDEYERAKVSFWRNLGERPVVIEVPGVEGISATELRRRMRDSEGWEELLAPGTADYFRQIGGIERFSRVRD